MKNKTFQEHGRIALKTAQEYRERVSQLRPRLFITMDMARLSNQKLGTSNYRCPPNEMLPSLATTYQGEIRLEYGGRDSGI